MDPGKVVRPCNFRIHRKRIGNGEEEKKNWIRFQIMQIIRYHVLDNNIGIVRFAISIFLLHFDSICDVVVQRIRYSR